MTYDIFKNKSKIEAFFRKYPDLFKDYEKKYILNYLNSFNKRELVPDLVREVYDELGIIPDDSNIYIAFIDFISRQYRLKDKNIIEVGGGVLPRLGKRIAANLDNGRIVVYDPRLSRYEIGTDKLKLVREKFTKDTDVENADLMIGLMPCEAANVIVDSATKNRIDFVLALCEGGPHGDEFDFFEDETEWLAYIIKETKRTVEENEMGKLKLKYMREYGNPYPIIYNDRG